MLSRFRCGGKEGSCEGSAKVTQPDGPVPAGPSDRLPGRIDFFESNVGFLFANREALINEMSLEMEYKVRAKKALKGIPMDRTLQRA
jgi:hypothetical protein